jgi:alanine racemase
MRPIRARIDASALRHNLGVARRQAPRSRVWAVVKASAYGHGLARAAKALDADGLALIELEAALELRRAGEKRPILLMQGFYTEKELEPIAVNGFTTVVHDAEQLAMLEKTRLPSKLPVYLKVNTGMNRLGFGAGEVKGVLERLARCAGEVTLMTHFADADGKRGVKWQLERFEAATKGLELAHSLANSAAILRYP